MSKINWEHWDKIELTHSKFLEQLIQKPIQEHSTGYYPDWDIKIDNTTFELKTDFGADKSGNMCVEYISTKTNTPSGIYSTKATMWSNVYYIDGEWGVGTLKTEIFKKYIKKALEHNVLFDVKNKKGMNTRVYLVRCSEYQKLIDLFGKYIKVPNPNTWTKGNN